MSIIINLSNRHMDSRAFGKDVTNLDPQDQHRKQRNYSLLHADRLRDLSLNPKPNILNSRNNRSHVEVKPNEIKLEINDPQMVPEYFSENLQFMKSREQLTYRLHDYIPSHKTVSEQARAKLIDWLSELHYKYKMFP